MVRYSIASSDSSGPYAKAMAGEVSWHPGRGHNLSKPIRQDVAWERLSILQQKQGARGISPKREVIHYSTNCTEWTPANTNVNETALPKWISLWALDPDVHAGWSWGWIHWNILDTQVEGWQEARQIGNGKLRYTKKAKISKGTSYPKHAVIWEVKI